MKPVKRTEIQLISDFKKYNTNSIFWQLIAPAGSVGAVLGDKFNDVFYDLFRGVTDLDQIHV